MVERAILRVYLDTPKVSGSVCFMTFLECLAFPLSGHTTRLPLGKKNELRKILTLTRVSTAGKVIERRSFARILINNDLQAMLLGRSGFFFHGDLMHLNQISVAAKDSLHWKQGDLLISARHLSTVFLYRPSTDKILWKMTGPWLNQHAAEFVDDHRISVFDNNIIGGAPVSQPFVEPNDINRVFVYDFDTRQTSQPFANLLAKARPVTITEGRARILPDVDFLWKKQITADICASRGTASCGRA